MNLLKLFKPKYEIEKVRLAFEYGVVMSQVAKEQGIEVTPELVKRAETMIENEFANQTAEFLAGNMTILIMTAFELDIRK